MAKTIVNPAIQKLRKIIVITFAALLMAANINTFVEAGGLYPGGATGITVLIRRVAELWFNVELPYTLVIIILNAIPIYIGYRYIGKKFTAYSVYMIIMTGVFSDMLPTYAITYDTLLVSIFGGMINGLAISICLIKGATSGGTDFIAIFLSDKKGMDSWNIILGINVVILGTAGFLFGWDKALYSIIFQYASTQILHTLYTRYQKETLFIVTNKPEEICVIISDLTSHGATLIEGEGSYEHCERNVVYSVVSREEYKKVVRAIKKVDPEAFVNTLRTEEISGQFYKRPEE
ncbi:MAG: YitT family protein [Lachnospiraceae bacterium]|nr:YitT family protein [Lachnospiraceae bacterium]